MFFGNLINSYASFFLNKGITEFIHEILKALRTHCHSCVLLYKKTYILWKKMSYVGQIQLSKTFKPGVSFTFLIY